MKVMGNHKRLATLGDHKPDYKQINRVSGNSPAIKDWEPGQAHRTIWPVPSIMRKMESCLWPDLV